MGRTTTKGMIYDVQPIRDLEQLEDMKWSLKKWCTERDYILFILGINTGLRVGDMLKLTVADVKRKERVVIREGKTKKKREIQIKGSLYKELNEYIKTLKSDWLFPSQKGDKAISTTQAYRQLVKASEMVDIEAIGTHTMRKTFGYHFYRRTNNIAALQKILNHSHPDITKRYIGITQDELNDLLDSFEL